MNRLMHEIQNTCIKPDFNANRMTLHTNGRRPKDVRSLEGEAHNELQVMDHRSSGSSGHEEDWHVCSMIGKWSFDLLQGIAETRYTTSHHPVEQRRYRT